MFSRKQIRKALADDEPFNSKSVRAALDADPETHKGGIAYGGQQYIPKSDYYAGRPTIYNQELCDKICNMLADGISLRKICAMEGMPNKWTILKWAAQPDHPFGAQYRAARQAQMEGMVEALHDLVADAPRDGVEMMRVRLMSDNIKWSASRLLPGIYGDRMAVDANVNQNIESFGPQAATQLANILVAAIKKREIVE